MTRDVLRESPKSGPTASASAAALLLVLVMLAGCMHPMMARFGRVEICDRCQSWRTSHGVAVLFAGERRIEPTEDTVYDVRPSTLLMSGLLRPDHVHQWRQITESVVGIEETTCD